MAKKWRRLAANSSELAALMRLPPRLRRRKGDVAWSSCSSSAGREGCEQGIVEKCKILKLSPFLVSDIQSPIFGIFKSRNYKNVEKRIINLRRGMVCKKLSRAEVGGSAGCGMEDNNLSSKLKRQKCGFEIENRTN